jgi:DNA-binding NarL/FixJ family response regulator
MNAAQGNVRRLEHVVLLYDAMPLRRAQLVCFLSDWAAAEKVSLRTPDSEEIGKPLELTSQCRMVVFSIGSMPVDHSPVMGDMVQIARSHGDIPAVILTEAGSARDAGSAFKAGAKGYIPATIEPDVALRALSFILNGGHFFPPSALQPTRSNGSSGDNGPRSGGLFGLVYHLRRGEREPGAKAS